MNELPKNKFPKSINSDYYIYTIPRNSGYYRNSNMEHRISKFIWKNILDFCVFNSDSYINSLLYTGKRQIRSNSNIHNVPHPPKVWSAGFIILHLQKYFTGSTNRCFNASFIRTLVNRRSCKNYGAKHSNSYIPSCFSISRDWDNLFCREMAKGDLI